MKYDKLQKTKAETAGFTLVEIVAVLVLLGILAAVAVPKFFDLSSDAEKKAAEAALMEAQVRINAGYSKAIYAGKSCEDAVEGVSSLEKIGDGGKNVINGYTLTLKDGNKVISDEPGSEVVVTKGGKSFDSSTFDNLKQIFKPKCNKTTGDASADNGLVCPDGSGGNSGGNTDNPSCPEAKCSVQLTCVNNKVNYSCSCTGNGSCEPPSETVELTCSTGTGGNGSGDAYEWGEDDLPCQGLVCPKGLVIKSGNDYFYITKDAWFKSEELSNPKNYTIEDLQAYSHDSALVKMNRSKKIECNGGCKPSMLNIGDIYFDANGKWYGIGWTSVKDAYQQPQSYWVELMFLHSSKFPGYE